MKNLESPAPQRRGPLLAGLFGCLGIGLLALLCLIVTGGLAYLRGYSVPPLLVTSTRLPTDTPLSSPAPASTSTLAPSPTFTFTATQTATASASPTATIIFPTPTLIPTRTRTPIPQPTKTRTPTPTQTPAFTTWNDSQHDFDYNGWIGLASKQAIANGMRCSNKKNELLVFDTGRNALALSLYFYRGPNQGKALIQVDDVLVGTVDLYRASPQYRFEWNHQFANPKQTHKVRVVVLREKRNASTGYQVCFDGFRLNSTFTDDTDYGIRYSTWSGDANGKALGQAYRLSATADSSVTFSLRGRSFQWVTALGPNYGQADVYVDGVLIATVDLYFPAPKWQHSILFNNLGPGKHTVTIIVLGQHNSASGGDGVVFDGILIP